MRRLVDDGTSRQEPVRGGGDGAGERAIGITV